MVFCPGALAFLGLLGVQNAGNRTSFRGGYGASSERVGGSVSVFRQFGPQASSLTSVAGTELR